MPRIRTIKPEYWNDAKVVRLSIAARLLYIGTWNWACDAGHLRDDPDDLALKVMPRDDVDAAALVQELVDGGFVERRETAEGRRYLHIRRFTEHQKTDPRWRPRCPFCEPETPRNSSEPTETPRNSPRLPGEGGEYGERINTSPPTPPPKPQRATGETPAPPAAATAASKRTTAPPRPPPPGAELFDAIADVCGWDTSQLTRNARGRLNDAVKQLRELRATPDDVQRRARTYRAKYPDVALTPQALTGNWASLNGARAGPAQCTYCGRTDHQEPRCPHKNQPV